MTAALLPTAGCARAKTGDPAAQGRKKLQVVTTLFPYYDFTRQITGDLVDLTLVVPAGMDSHSFEPTPADMLAIQNADVLICNGGEMEHWLSEVLDAVDTSEMKVITMMDYVETFEEETVEGMEEGAEHHHSEEEHGDYVDHDGFEVEIEYDEHIWTSPVNAMKIVSVISTALQEEDPEHADIYIQDEEIYLELLREIDGDLRDVMKHAKRNMIVVGDKFPFRYLAEEYKMDYRAAFSGCSTDTEPSAKTIAYLIDKVREEQIPVVYYLELSSHRVSEIIGEETGAVPLLLHSCHNVTRKEFDDGITYIDLMRQNVINLRKGLDE
nr:metal ABC transporter substrate-binding protein [Clostridium sp. MCC353]